MMLKDAECPCCHMEAPLRARLAHATTGGEVQVCWRCLRTAVLATADAYGTRGGLILGTRATDDNGNCWRSANGRYVVPSLVTDLFGKGPALPFTSCGPLGA